MPAASLKTLRLHPDDPVVVALRDLAPGDEVEGVALRERVEHGHKVSVRAIETGAPVRKYGQIIGIASRAIAAGEHVHTHNLA
ncbi:MAG: UxaA family hydrolase, partial [Hyphomicrobiales bacterium]